MPVGGAGRARHDPVGKGAADPGARHRGRGDRRLQPDRHRQQPRPRRQRAVERPAAALQHGRAAAAGDRRRGDGHRRPARRRARAGARPARGARRRRTRSAGSSRSSASCATGDRPTGGPAEDRRAARCRRPRRSRSSPTAWRSPPTSATDGCAGVTSRPASSVRSSVIRARRRGPGASTWRRWSASGTAGGSSTRPAATSGDRGRSPACTCSACDITDRGRRARRARPRRAGTRRSCSSSCRPTPRRCCGGSVTRGCGRRSPCSATWRPTRAGGVLAARRVQPGVAGGPWALAHERRRCDRSTAPPAGRWPRCDERSAGRGARSTRSPLGRGGGRPDAERWWDDVVEHRGDGVPAFAAVGEAMAAVREGHEHVRRRRPAGGAHARAVRAASPTPVRTRWPWSAGPGTSRRSSRAGQRRRPTQRLQGAARGEGRGDLGAVDAPPAGARQRLRRRRRLPGLVRPCVPPPRPHGSPAGSQAAASCSREDRGVAGARDRRRAGWPTPWPACGAPPTGVRGARAATTVPVATARAVTLALDHLVVGDRLGRGAEGAPTCPSRGTSRASSGAARLGRRAAGPAAGARPAQATRGAGRRPPLHRLAAPGVDWGPRPRRGRHAPARSGRVEAGAGNRNWRIALVEGVAPTGRRVEAAAAAHLGTNGRPWPRPSPTWIGLGRRGALRADLTTADRGADGHPCRAEP